MKPGPQGGVPLSPARRRLSRAPSRLDTIALALPPLCPTRGGISGGIRSQTAVRVAGNEPVFAWFESHFRTHLRIPEMPKAQSNGSPRAAEPLLPKRFRPFRRRRGNPRAVERFFFDGSTLPARPLGFR